MLLSGQWRVNRVISASVERSNGYITQSSRASCSKYMGYIKIAIISFFIVNCWPYAVESALLNFAKNAFIILPYTHDIHVLAVHVEMSLFMMLNKLNRLLPSCCASPLRSILRSRTSTKQRASPLAPILRRVPEAPALGSLAQQCSRAWKVVRGELGAVNVCHLHCLNTSKALP